MLPQVGSHGPFFVAKTLSAAAALAGLAGSVAAPVALAQSSGAAALSAPQPSIASIACSSACPAAGTVERGGTVTLSGQQLDTASTVVFLGGRGTSDDARVRVSASDPAQLDVRVPAKARSGQVVITTAAGVATQSKTVSIRIVRASSTTPSAKLPAPVLAPVAGVAQLDAGVATRKAGKGASAAAIAYVSHAPAAVAVRVDVVSVDDGLSIFDETRVAAPEQPQTLTWEGKGSVAGAVALDGRYEVRISTGPASGARTVFAGGDGAAMGGAAPQGSPAPAASARIGGFTFVGAVFPVAGTHNFGQGEARFGMGRAGHSHEGQDVLTACGTPIVAAQGGVVKQKAFQSAAGNYVVIGSTASGEDNMYAHFRAPAVVARGARVQTGQVIGYAGDTGSASACHLHFEIWTAPGWYSGGHPIDPLSTLKAWEKLG